MGKARARRRQELREQGLLPRKEVKGQDIKQLIPVMDKLQMTGDERRTFQSAILGYMLFVAEEAFGLFPDYDKEIPSAVREMDALPEEHRDAAYQFVIDELEEVLQKKGA